MRFFVHADFEFYQREKLSKETTLTYKNNWAPVQSLL